MDQEWDREWILLDRLQKQMDKVKRSWILLDRLRKQIDETIKRSFRMREEVLDEHKERYTLKRYRRPIFGSPLPRQ